MIERRDGKMDLKVTSNGKMLVSPLRCCCQKCAANWNTTITCGQTDVSTTSGETAVTLVKTFCVSLQRICLPVCVELDSEINSVLMEPGLISLVMMALKIRRLYGTGYLIERQKRHV